MVTNEDSKFQQLNKLCEYASLQSKTECLGQIERLDPKRIYYSRSRNSHPYTRRQIISFYVPLQSKSKKADAEPRTGPEANLTSGSTTSIQVGEPSAREARHVISSSALSRMRRRRIRRWIAPCYRLLLVVRWEAGNHVGISCPKNYTILNKHSAKGGGGTGIYKQ